MNENSGEIILYQPDNSIRLEVRMQEEFSCQGFLDNCLRWKELPHTVLQS